MLRCSSTNLPRRSLLSLVMSSSSSSSESVSSRPRRLGWSQLSNPTHTPHQGSRSERVPAREIVPGGGSRLVPARRVDVGDAESRASPEKVGGGSNTMSSHSRRVGWSQLSNPMHTPQQGSRSERGSRSVPARRMDPGDTESRVSPEKVGGGAPSPNGRVESSASDLCSMLESTLVLRPKWNDVPHGGNMSVSTRRINLGDGESRVSLEKVGGGARRSNGWVESCASNLCSVQDSVPVIRVKREVVPQRGSVSVPVQRMDGGDGEPQTLPEKVGGGAMNPDGQVENCASNLCSTLESALVLRPHREVVPHGGNMSVPARRMDKDGGIRVFPEKVGGGARSSDGRVEGRAFDLCPVQNSAPVIRLKRSLLEQNRDRRMHASSGQRHIVPRPGMVLLKSFLSHRDQVTLIRECQGLGLGPGGFYQPGYRDGAKLHLQMMCLGKNWDPETKKYHDIRSYDESKPPLIPEPFKKMVESAMQASHDLIRRSYEGRAEYELPNFSPDLCIVNFYSNSGKLGVHQDQDESKESLRKGLPVVSFSVGDSADFQYGDDREATNTVKLESGDVLIFGGKSRDIFHGVSKIYPQTAPTNLIEETNLRPGRLNLTFRQY